MRSPYSMNEITKHVANDREYYSFALANAQITCKQFTRGTLLTTSTRNC